MADALAAIGGSTLGSLQVLALLDVSIGFHGLSRAALIID